MGDYIETLEEQEISSATDAQEKALSLVPIVPALLSVWGSANIIYIVLANKKKTTSYRRIMCGLSICDIASSLVIPWQAFLVPADTSQRLWAFGNAATCDGLGFLQQLSFSNIWYNGFLSFFFLATVKFGVKERVMARRYEPWMHVIAIGYPLVTASVGLGMGVYDEVELGQGCWVTNYPKGCGCMEEGEGNGVCCLSPTIAYIFAGIPSFFTFLALVINNLLVYCHVRGTIRRESQHNGNYLDESEQTSSVTESSSRRGFGIMRRRSSSRHGNADRNENKIRRVQAVATQTSLYVAGFLLCYLPSMTLRIMESRSFDAEDEYQLFPLLLLQALLLPLQGLFNCFIFIRPTYLRVRKDYSRESRFWALRRALYGDKVEPSDFGNTTRRDGSSATRRPDVDGGRDNALPKSRSKKGGDNGRQRPQEQETLNMESNISFSWGAIDTSNIGQDMKKNQSRMHENAPSSRDDTARMPARNGEYSSTMHTSDTSRNFSEDSFAYASSSSWCRVDVSDVSQYMIGEDSSYVLDSSNVFTLKRPRKHRNKEKSREMEDPSERTHTTVEPTEEEPSESFHQSIFSDEPICVIKADEPISSGNNNEIISPENADNFQQEESLFHLADEMFGEEKDSEEKEDSEQGEDNEEEEDSGEFQCEHEPQDPKDNR